MAILAPIALFVYNRPRHTRQAVEALLRSKPAAESDLAIFSGGQKPEAQVGRHLIATCVTK